MQLESEQTAPAILDWFVRGAVGQQQKIRQDFPGERLINPRVFRQALWILGEYGGETLEQVQTVMTLIRASLGTLPVRFYISF